MSGLLVHFWTRNLIEKSVLTKVKLDGTEVRLEPTPLKSPRCLAQDIGISKSEAK
jgi:hypothetical protein